MKALSFRSTNGWHFKRIFRMKAGMSTKLLLSLAKNFLLLKAKFPLSSLPFAKGDRAIYTG